MELRVNGNTLQVDDGATLVDLLARVHVSLETSGVAVAVNDAVVPQREWSATTLHDGDAIEVIHAVSGG